MENQTNNTSVPFPDLYKDIKPDFQAVFGAIWGFVNLLNPRPSVKLHGSQEQLCFTFGKQLKVLVDKNEKDPLQMNVTFKSFISQCFLFPLQTDQIINALVLFVSGISDENPTKLTRELLESMDDKDIICLTKGDLTKSLRDAMKLGIRDGEQHCPHYLYRNRLY